MTSLDGPFEVARRYRMLGEIGQGQMGMVYRAQDRLTGEIVAFKQVTEPSYGGVDPETLWLALAREFRLLSSLRHPHIITVLDYGFHREPGTVGFPFYTMEYLQEARSLTEAAAGMPLAQRLDLLAQLLDALVYLHRRGILHRDLKPANVLVTDGYVSVVDFGMSIFRQQPHLPDRDNDSGIAGTLLYMAPEMVHGPGASAAADLYSVGVMAYELLAGQHPYSDWKIKEFITRIRSARPDFSRVDAPGPVVDVVRRLMAGEARDRYDSAAAALADLQQASGQAVSPPSTAIRESFLQAAQFVGRQREFTTLCGAVDRALNGEGAAWLIRGESGVGKTRLLEELRAYAMVQGAHVLTGQAVRMGQVYGLWRDVMLRLALLVDLTDEEVASFCQRVPDMPRLMGRLLPDRLPLHDSEEPASTKTSLLDALSAALERLVHPRPNARLGREAETVVILLEDCHWADSGSLYLLNKLAKITSGLHLLLVATHRSDEGIRLVDNLTGFETMTLERLDTASIAELSTSMLGNVGRQPDVLDLLQRETEGNVFFMVEVVRALAEGSDGHLDRIGLKTLPESVFAGGIHKLVQHRLSRIPEQARPLLRIAAVAGRHVNLEMLREISPQTDIEAWLSVGVDAAILSSADASSTRSRWWFAHDKLRDALLDEISHEQRREIHLLIAQTLEAMHTGERRKPYAIHLAYHWRQVGTEPARELHYTWQAAKQTSRAGANREAEWYYARALELLPHADDEDRQTLELELLIGLGVSMVAVKGYATPEIVAVFSRARRLVQDLNITTDRMLPVLTLMSSYFIARGEYATAEEVGREMVTLARKLRHKTGVLRGILTVGESTGFQGDLHNAERRLRYVIERYDPDLRRADSVLQDFGVTAYELLAVVRWMRGYPDEALRLSEQGLAIARQINHPISVVFALHWTSIVYFMRGEYGEAISLSQVTMEQAYTGKFWLFYALGGLYEAISMAASGLHHPVPTMTRMQEALHRFYQTGAIFCQPYFKGKLALSLAADNRFGEALALLDAALQQADELGEHWFTPELYRIRGDLLYAQSAHVPTVQAAYEKALEHAVRMQARSWALRAAMSLARLWQNTGRASDGYQLLKSVYDSFTEGHDTRDLREAHALLAEFTGAVKT